MNQFKNKSFKQLACCNCGWIVAKVDAAAAAVKCWKCVTEELSGISQDIAEAEFKKSSKNIDQDCTNSN